VINITITLAEEVTFLNKGSIMQTLSHLPEDTTVVIDGSKSHNIDIDVLEIIHDFKNTAELKNIKLELKNIPEFIGVAGH
jgi:MFS superfamily sulfate permease-like transporter